MLQPPNHQDYNLLPHRIKWLSEEAPLRTYALIPKNPQDIAAGFDAITYWDLAVAVNRAAWWLRANLNDDERCFAYRGPNDLRWSALLVGAIIAGKIMIHISPGFPVNTIPEGQHCSVLVDGDNDGCSGPVEAPTITTEYDPAAKLRRLTSPPLQNWFNNSFTELPKFEYGENWADSADKEVAIFHAPGISGNPEPVRWSNRKIASWHAILELATKDQSVLVPDVIGKTVFNVFNPAQLEGQSFQLLLPIYFGNPVVLGHPSRQLNSDTIRQILVYASCTSIITPPCVLDELTECPRTLAQLRSLESIMVVGTGLPLKCYDLLRCPGLNVQSVYGCPQLLPLIQKRQLQSTASFMSFHQYSGATFRPRKSGFQELIVVRNEQHLSYQNNLTCQPQPDTYATGDLFSTYHTLPGQWRFERRMNNSITLRNGEHVSVTETERVIGTHLLVKSAIIYGNMRTRPVLVIEPWSDAMASLRYGRFEQDFIEEIWSHVEEANQQLSESNKLCQRLTHIMKTPVVRSNHSTIDRQRTEDMIKNEINALYTNFQQSEEPVPEEKKIKNIKNPRSRGEEIQRNLRFLQTFRDVHAI